jgi:hypothetical protein
MSVVVLITARARRRASFACELVNCTARGVMSVLHRRVSSEWIYLPS